MGHHVLLADELRDLGKGAVAGVGEGLLQGLGAMGLLTGDGFRAVFQFPITGEGLLLDTRHAVQRRGRGDDLKDGAGNISRLEEAVDEHALVSIVPFHIRHVVRIIGRGGQGAENLTGFVVVHGDGAFSPCHGLQGCILHMGGQGQGGCAAGACGIVNAVDPVKARHLRGIAGDRTGANIALPVPQPVEGGFAGSHIA